MSDGRVGTFLALVALALGGRLAGSRAEVRRGRTAELEPVDPTRGPFRTMAEVREANRRKHAANQGVYFFDRGKKRFHRDLAYAGPYRGRYFGVLSGNTGWSLYRIADDGGIDHIGQASKVLGEAILDKADVRRAAEVAAEREREKAGSRGVVRSGRGAAAVIARAPVTVVLRKSRDDDPNRRGMFWYHAEVWLDGIENLWESPWTNRDKAMKAAAGISNSLGKACIHARNDDDEVGAILRKGQVGSGVPVRIVYGEGRMHVEGLVDGTWIRAAGDGLDSDEEISATIDRWFDAETAERLFRDAVPSGSRGVVRSGRSRPGSSWPQACRIGDLKYPPYELSDALRAQVLDNVERGEIVDALKAIRKAHDALRFGHENLHRAQITMYVEAIRAGLPGGKGSTLADWWKGDIRRELLK